MSALLEQLPHPLTDGVTALEDALDRMPVDGWRGLEPDVLRSAAERLMRIEARVKAHLLAATRALEDTGAAKDAGATSTGALLAGAFGGDRRAADAMVHRGKRLEAAPATEQALAGGKIGAAQADIIAGAIKDLPDDTTAEQKQACEDTLIGDAARYSLKDLRSRARRITDQFKPEPEVDQTENDTLQDQEKKAWGASEFWMRSNGNGTTTGGFTLPDAQADMLMAAIKAVSAPRRDHLRDHPGAAGQSPEDGETGSSFYDRELAYRTRLGMGFAEVCSRLPGHLLPGRTGLGATLLVHLDLATLVDGVKAATLSSGTRISASQARLMACQLGIIPQVFGGKSVPLDHGHEQRLFTKAQKQALSARDGGCTAPGCDRPPEQCEGHHWRQPWSHGGATTLDDGVLICPFHHRRVHEQNWQARLGPTGHIQWRRPGDATWQQNHRWRP
ncbi:HNH endonuclease signature motif containing protein [Aeromicrobium wangtongii]|uniref:HNH endonuclease signature motif containing protein n=1 Tax=Aeromicrobium wangtongii TaxID=2969247 RepID=UPI0020171330|nr:HNH endonuclease signature motif containing protein [Aeromicrobium wangtongii]MCL3819050.1 HNH endonuclease [Aeromicrobium wangtongii]